MTLRTKMHNLCEVYLTDYDEVHKTDLMKKALRGDANTARWL